MTDSTRIVSVLALGAVLVSPLAFGAADLKITEIYEGVSGEDVTADWVEVTNFGDMAFTFGTDGELYHEDSSADPTTDEQITGITVIAPGESVIYMVSNDAADVTDFVSTWGTGGVQVGYLAGDNPGGLGSGGEQIYLYDSNLAGAGIVDSVAYTGVGTAGIEGSTWAWNTATGTFDGFTQSIDGVNGAYTASTPAGDFGEIPLIASPGVVPEPASLALLATGGLLVVRRRRETN